jgi:hypothetical protein
LEGLQQIQTRRPALGEKGAQLSLGQLQVDRLGVDVPVRQRVGHPRMISDGTAGAFCLARFFCACIAQKQGGIRCRASKRNQTR